MAINNSFYIKQRMSFSLKFPNREVSDIRVRFKVDDKRYSYYLPTTCKIQCAHWDSERGCAIEDPKRNPSLKGNPRLQQILRNINVEIDKTASALLNILESCTQQNIKMPPEQIQEELRRVLRHKEIKQTEPKQEEKPITDFLAFLDLYIVRCREGKILNSGGTKLTTGSIRNYISTLSILKHYCKDRKIKLTFDSINLDFYSDFIDFLNNAEHSRGMYKPNVIGKFVKNIKVVMRYAYNNHHTQNDSFKLREFKVFQESVETIYLTEQELQRIKDMELPTNQSQVRDSFLVSCYTSLRFSDISRLGEKHIDFANNTITITTQKTNKVVVIPIHPTVLEIFEKYGRRVPPVQSNQATNRMLKKICNLCGINNPVTIMETSGGVRTEKTYEKWQLVSSHTARRSFATNAFKRGVPTLSIMQITGHQTESSFMRYIRISTEENAAILQSHDFFN